MDALDGEIIFSGLENSVNLNGEGRFKYQGHSFPHPVRPW
jgi:hypothetical protein